MIDLPGFDELFEPWNFGCLIQVIKTLVGGGTSNGQTSLDARKFTANSGDCIESSGGFVFSATVCRAPFPVSGRADVAKVHLFDASSDHESEVIYEASRNMPVFFPSLWGGVRGGVRSLTPDRPSPQPCPKGRGRKS
jgi:hypothetical protein